MPWFGLKRKDSAPVYKKGHLGQENQMQFVEGKGWIMKGEDAPETASSLPPPPKSSKTSLSDTPASASRDSDAESSSSAPGAGRGRGRGGPIAAPGNSLASRYAKPQGSTATSTIPGVLIPRPGLLGVGRGRGRRAGIKTFVPGSTGSPTAKATPSAGARVFNPYASSTPAFPEQPLPTEPTVEETSQTDLQSAASVLPPSPFATHAPPPSASSIAPSAASEAADESGEPTQAESAQAESADAVESGETGSAAQVPAAQEETTPSQAAPVQDPLAAAMGTEAPEEEVQEAGEQPAAFELEESAQDPFDFGEGAPAPPLQDDFLGAGNASQALDDFGGVLEQEPNLDSVTPQGPALDPPGNQEPALNGLGGANQAVTSADQGAQGEPVFDEAAMETRAAEANAKSYEGMDWNYAMAWGQQQKEAGYPEDQVAGWLQQYGVDLEVYQYWLSRYFDAAWYSWYQQTYLPEMTGVPYAAIEAKSQTESQDQAEDALTPREAASAQFEDALVPEDSTSAQLESPGDGYDLSAPTQALGELESAQAQSDFRTQPSAALSTMAEQGSMMPDSALLGTDSALLGTEAPPIEQAASAVTTAEGPFEQTQTLSAEGAQGESELTEDYPLSFSLGGEPESEPRVAESQKPEVTQEGELTQEDELAQEDSFAADQAAAAQPSTSTPTKGNGGPSSLTWSNPAYDLLQSPEQALGAASAGLSPLPEHQTGSSFSHERPDIGRELSFGTSPQPAQSNGNGNGVQHVESLGQWLPRPAMDAATRRASTKLSGPLPWDDLSSSEDEFSPRPRRAPAVPQEAAHANRASPRASANGTSKAPAPNSPSAGVKSPRAAKGISIADQIAFGAKTAQELLQGPGKSAWEQVKGYALPQASPPQLYRLTPELDALYGDDKSLEDQPLHSDEEEESAPRAARKLDMGPVTPQDASPPHTPRSLHEEEEDQEPLSSSPAKKRTGNEQMPSSELTAQSSEAEDEEAAEELALSDGEGWEGFSDDGVVQPLAESPQSASGAKAEKLSLQPAEEEDEQSQQTAGDIASPEGPHQSQQLLTDAGLRGASVPELGSGDLNSSAGGATIPESVGRDDASAEAQEEGWEGLDDELELELPAQDSVEEATRAESQDSAQETPVLDSEQKQAASMEDFAPVSTERESLLEAQLNALREQLSSRDGELAELREQIAGHDSRAGHLDSASSESSAVREQLAETQSKAERELKTQAALLGERDVELDAVTQQLTTLQAELRPVRTERDSLKRQLSDSEKRCDALSSEYDEMSEQLEKLTRQLSAQSKESSALTQRVKELSQTLEQAVSQRADATQQLSSQAEEISTLSLRVTDLEQSLEQAESERDEAAQHLSTQAKETADVSQELAESTQRLRQAEDEQAETVSQLNSQIAQAAELSQQLQQLTQQLQESEEACERATAEHELFVQQLSGKGSGAERVPESPPGSPARRLQASLEELADLRSKFEVSEGRILELEEEAERLQGRAGRAEEAVQDHLAMRERQTERIKKVKGAGPKSLPHVTAEREEAILRADKAEDEMRKLVDQRNALLEKLEGLVPSSPSGSGPGRGPSGSGFGPAPEEHSGSTTQVAELTQQIEMMKRKCKALETDLESASNNLSEEKRSADQEKARLAKESALLRETAQQAEQSAQQAQQELQQAQQHSQQAQQQSQQAQQQAQHAQRDLEGLRLKAQQAEAVQASMSQEREELRSECEAATTRAEALTTERDTVQQQLDEQLVRADRLSVLEHELVQATGERDELDRKVESLEQEAQEQYEAYTAKEQECDRLEAQLLSAQQQATSEVTSSSELESLRAELESLRAELSSAQSQAATAVSRIADLERELEAAVATRDEFVYHLSPHKQRPPLPLGSPAPKASQDQLRAALKAARSHAAEMEQQAQEETVGAEEAYLLLGDAEVTIAVLSDALEENGLDMDAILEAQMGGDDYGEEDEQGNDEEEHQAVQEGPDVQGWLHGSEAGFDSPITTQNPAGTLDSPARASAHTADNSPRSPGRPQASRPQSPARDGDSSPESPRPAQAALQHREQTLPETLPEPPLQEAASPMLKSIPFMQPAAVSPTYPNELSLESWGGAGPFGSNGSAPGPFGGTERATVTGKITEGWDEYGFDWMEDKDASGFDL